jgi:hypothetical protein
MTTPAGGRRPSVVVANLIRGESGPRGYFCDHNADVLTSSVMPFAFLRAPKEQRLRLRLAVRTSTTLLCCLSMLTGAAGQASKTPSFEELLTGIRKSESQLLNLRVDGKCQHLKWEPSKQDWQYDGEADATAWYAGCPGSNMRVDIHWMISPWEDGLAPFCQERRSSAYDGKVGQSLRSLGEFAPVNLVKTPEGRLVPHIQLRYLLAHLQLQYLLEQPSKSFEGEITADVPFFLQCWASYSGRWCSLYGCREQLKKPLSDYLEVVRKRPEFRCSVSAIRYNIRTASN